MLVSQAFEIIHRVNNIKQNGKEKKAGGGHKGTEVNCQGAAQRTMFVTQRVLVYGWFRYVWPSNWDACPLNPEPGQQGRHPGVRRQPFCVSGSPRLHRALVSWPQLAAQQEKLCQEPLTQPEPHSLKIG